MLYITVTSWRYFHSYVIEHFCDSCFLSDIVPPGGPDKRNSAEAVQDCEETHKHQPCPAVWKQGERKE